MREGEKIKKILQTDRCFNVERGTVSKSACSCSQICRIGS